MYDELESGKRRKSRSRARSPSDEGVGIGSVFLTLLVLVAVGLSIWALVESLSKDDPYCRSDCCKETRVHDFFDFSNPRTQDDFCIDRSTSGDDADCPFIFFPIAYGSVDGSDGSFGTGSDVLQIDSRPFTLSAPANGSGPVAGGGLDHVKFLTYVSDREGGFKAYPTRSHGNCADATELVYEGNVTCLVDLAEDNIPPSYNILFAADDYRLAACGFNTIALPGFNDGDTGVWQVADFFLTNRSIFIINERLPFGKTSFGGDLDYAAYTEVVRVARRNPTDYHKLAIVFNAAKGTIRWLIDDEEVYKVIRPGFTPNKCNTAILHGGTDKSSFPEHVSVGFGTFTILDAYHWDGGICEGSGAGPLARLDDYSDAYLNPHHFGQLDPNVLDDGDFDIPFTDLEDRIWGQGAFMGVDYVRVYNQKCGCSN